MPDSQIAISTYTSFITDQSKRLERLLTKQRVFVGGVAVVLIALLIFLRSPARVWAFVVVLYGATYFGLDRIRQAFVRLSDAYQDLEALTKFLAEPRSRDEVVAYIRPKVGPDGSNVPEAAASICSGTRSGESLKSAASAAFAQPISKLALAHYLRSLLILGGLFGTVLFFAIELGGTEILRGELSTLLPGLRGALASTLAGIMGSMSIGYLVSDADQMVEESVWETEAFFGGPLAQALAAVPDDPRITNETLLWQSLIEQVKALRDDTATSYDKLAADVHAYSLALKEVSTRLSELPQIQVPPQLVKLQDTVSDFSRGTASLHHTATTLVDAVTRIGLLAPTKTLEELGRIRQEIAALPGGLQARLDTSVTLVTDSVRHIVTDSSKGLTDALAGHTNSIGAKVDAVGVPLARIATGFDEFRREISQHLPAAGGARPARVTEATGGSNTPLDEGATRAVPAEIATVKSIIDSLPDRILRAQATAMGEMKQELASTTARLSRLERAAAWLERANRAPLMRLLTLSWRRPRPRESNGATT